MSLYRKKKIVEEMLNYRPPPAFNIERKSPNFDSWNGVSAESRELLSKNPNAFFIGALFDYWIKSDKAWEAPYHLKNRLGHLNINKISKMVEEELAVHIGPNKHRKAIHTHHNKMAGRLISACILLMEKYEGNAENIWKRDQNIEVVKSNLREFNGIGQKIANMFVNLLNITYGVVLKGWSEVDVAVDRHVARVFLRTSLIDSEQEKKIYKEANVKRGVILSARELSPKFPGALDRPAFEIGKYWCTAQKAKCNYDGNPCPLNEVCAKDKIDYSIVNSRKPVQF